MNYGKKSASKKRNSLISRSSMMGKRAHVSFIRVLFIGLIALCVAVSSLGIGSIRGILANTPDVNEVDIMPLGYATFLYDCNGNQIRKLAAPNANRLPVSIDQIPEDLQHAVVAIEDERFYDHNGIDLKGIVRALVADVRTRDFSQGASTLTQQLIKNNVLSEQWANENDSNISKMEKMERQVQPARECDQSDDGKHDQEQAVEPRDLVVRLFLAVEDVVTHVAAAEAETEHRQDGDRRGDGGGQAGFALAEDAQHERRVGNGDDDVERHLHIREQRAGTQLIVMLHSVSVRRRRTACAPPGTASFRAGTAPASCAPDSLSDRGCAGSRGSARR